MEVFLVVLISGLEELEVFLVLLISGLESLRENSFNELCDPLDPDACNELWEPCFPLGAGAAGTAKSSLAILGCSSVSSLNENTNAKSKPTVREKYFSSEV